MINESVNIVNLILLKKTSEVILEQAVIEEFAKSRNKYGTRKLKKILTKRRSPISRRRVGRTNLLSNYTKQTYKVHSKEMSQSHQIENTLDRNFDYNEPMKVIVTDLTYVNIAGNWFYTCFILDLFNREIISYSLGPNKTVDLVHQALATIEDDLGHVGIFIPMIEKFDNYTINDLLHTFDILHSLSHKGNPYDNVVAESTYKLLKIEFIYQHIFQTLYELQYHLMDYVNWWNKYRLHDSLGYVSPMDYKQAQTKSRNCLKSFVYR